MLYFSMLRGLEYESDGSLRDDTGHVWNRVSAWVEPVEAERLVAEGVRFAVQRCLTPPAVGRAERFRRDVKARMLTAAASKEYEDKNSVPTVVVGELWRSQKDGDLLLFIEQAPFERGDEELQNDW